MVSNGKLTKRRERRHRLGEGKCLFTFSPGATLTCPALLLYPYTQRLRLTRPV